jgi:predicted GNAT superfamily acetyltransferase
MTLRATYTLEPVCEDCRMEPEPVTKADFDAIIESLPAFWGERDPVELHHPMFLHEFGDGALLIRDKQGAVAAYLFGFFLPEHQLAYVHIVAVREDHRGQGLAYSLYDRFRHLARERGCERIKAIARPDNAASIAFHRAMGMEAVETPDYSGLGGARVVFSAQLRD